MIIIILNWLLIFFICYITGSLFAKAFGLLNSTAINLIYGIIANTFCLSIVAFFYPINNNILYAFFCINAVLFIVNYKLFTGNFFKVNKQIFTWQGLILFIATIAFAAYSSCVSKINDDGLYYTQTLKWLTEYGFVHGISNLHVSFGLSSSWHIFQSLFIFSEQLYTNDVNGFLMLVYTMFIVEKICKSTGSFFSAIQYILVLLISIPFYSAPNPDIAVIVFSAIAIDMFLHKQDIRTIVVIGVFCITIKISAIGVFLLSMVCIYYVINTYKNNFLLLFFLLLIGILFCFKNAYQTGYPLYPIKYFALQTADWKTPEPIVTYFLSGIKTWAYTDKYIPKDVLKNYNINVTDMVQILLSRGAIKGPINIFIFISALLTLVVFLYQLLAKKVSKNIVIVFFICGLNLFIWLLLAPQYRFILSVIIFFIAWLSNIFLSKYYIKLNTTIKYKVLFVVISLFALPAIFGTELNLHGTRSKELGQFEKITWERFIYPSPQYQFFLIDTTKINGLDYYHPAKNRYCWNAKLPCMSESYDKNLFVNFNCKIALRDKHLRDGFKLIRY